MSHKGLMQAPIFVPYLRAYNARGAGRAGLALETLLEKGRRQKGDDSAMECSREAHGQLLPAPPRRSC